MDTLTYVIMHMCMYSYVNACDNGHANVDVNIGERVNSHVNVRVYMYVCMSSCTYIHTHICVYIYIYVYRLDSTCICIPMGVCNLYLKHAFEWERSMKHHQGLICPAILCSHAAHGAFLVGDVSGWVSRYHMSYRTDCG